MMSMASKMVQSSYAVVEVPDTEDASNRIPVPSPTALQLSVSASVLGYFMTRMGRRGDSRTAETTR